MRVSSVSNNSSISNLSNIKKPLSLETMDYLDNYSQENFKHTNLEIIKDDKSNKLLDHQAVFSFDTKEEEYVSNLYEDTKTLMNELENMIFNHASTYHLKEGYEKLKSDDSIQFGIHNDDSYGFISYLSNNVSKSDIFITTDQSVVGVATTLVHELQHHYDLNKVAKEQKQSIDTFSLELNAFAKEFEFLNDGHYIYDESYISLPQIAKDVYVQSNEMKINEINHPQSIAFMSNLFEQIGYEEEMLFKKEFVSDINVELKKIINTSNELNRIVFDSLVKK